MKKHILLRIVLLFIALFLANRPLTAQDGGTPPPAPPEERTGSEAAAVSAQMGTAFTYQGELKQNGTGVSASCDFQFSLFDAASAGTQVGATQTRSNVAVSNGLFTISNLDFGAGAFNGEARWLQIGVRCPAGSGSYTALTPRQALTPTPYALALPGLYTLQNATSPNLIGGHHNNSVTNGVVGATIGGGGSSISTNRVTNDYGTVGGGAKNQAGNNAGTVDDGIYATVGGGYINTASGTAATVGGGARNTASGDGATVGGGASNTASGDGATVGGGSANTASDRYATVGGGQGNTASYNSATVGGGGGNTASGDYAVVPGGASNTALGDYSFAAGRRAKANSHGSFVWGANVEADIVAPAVNSFSVRAPGGIWLGTTNTPSIPSGRFLNTSSGAHLTTGGVWTNASDRHAKENFSPVNAQSVLAQVAALPLTTWNYRAEDATVRHIGPMAQDFHAAFGLGADDVTISTVDANGIALAAIQGLHQLTLDQQAKLAAQESALATQDAEIAVQSEEIAKLTARLAALEKQANGNNLDLAYGLPGWLLLTLGLGGIVAGVVGYVRPR
jgi:hypothetical protein